MGNVLNSLGGLLEDDRRTRGARCEALVPKTDEKRTPEGVSSIKQVFLLKSCRAVPWCRRYKRHEFNNRREQAPALRQKEYGQFCSYSFSHSLPARYSVLHRFGVLSEGKVFSDMPRTARRDIFALQK